MQTIDFTDLLGKRRIAPKAVPVLRHRPTQPELRRVLPWLAAEKPRICNAYQQTQSPKVEKAMARARYVASSIGYKAGKALFVGLYKNRGKPRPLTKKTYWKEPGNIALRRHAKWDYDDSRPSVLWFDLVLTDIYAEWKGKLVVGWPRPDRAWYRFPNEKNTFPVLAIQEPNALLETEVPSWRRLVLTWDELKTIPTNWQAKLKEWRGVYLIYDVRACKGYVGSASGRENLYHRWRDYAKSGHGNNKHLKTRDPRNFRFSILQRVSPDTSKASVTRLEHTWIRRLHTIEPFGLNSLSGRRGESDKSIH